MREEVRLTAGEVQECREWARARDGHHLEREERQGRLGEGIRTGGHGYVGTDEDSLKRDEEGIYAECAFAKWSGLPWVAFSKEYKKIEADVGEYYQVRATRYVNGGLILHKPPLPGGNGDRADQIYVLGVVREEMGQLPWVEFVGWKAGWTGQLPVYWETEKGDFAKRPAYLVPASALRRMGELKEWPEEEIRRCLGKGLVLVD